MSFEEDQSVSPQTMQLLYKDYFELKAPENQQMKKVPFSELPLSDKSRNFWEMRPAINSLSWRRRWEGQHQNGPEQTNFTK